jgi:hypothetical protein
MAIMMIASRRIPKKLGRDSCHECEAPHKSSLLSVVELEAMETSRSLTEFLAPIDEPNGHWVAGYRAAQPGAQRKGQTMIKRSYYGLAICVRGGLRHAWCDEGDTRRPNKFSR